MTRRDHILLGSLLAAFWLAFGLHVYQVWRTGLAQPEAIARADPDGGPPTVGGWRPDRRRSNRELQLGDRLLRVGDTDLRGVGYFGFEAIALSESARYGARVPVEIERDGRRLASVLAVAPAGSPWYRIPFLLAVGMVGVLLLRVRAVAAESRWMGAALVALGLLESPFYGDEPALTYAYYALFWLWGPVTVWIMLRAVLRFPGEVPPAQRLSLRWSWIAVLFPVVRLGYVWSAWPIPAEWTPRMALAGDVIFLAVGLGALTWNHAHASALGQRRVRWVLLGGWLATAPMALTLLSEVLGAHGEPALYASLFEWSAVAGAFAPLGVAIALLLPQRFDLDRWTATVALGSAAAVAGVALLQGVAPALGAPIARTTGLPATLVEALWIVLVVAAAVPFVRRLRPALEHWLMPRRRERLRALESLERELGSCRVTDEVWSLLASRLASLIDTDSCRVVRDREAGDDESRWLAEASLRSALERHPTPRRVRRRAGLLELASGRSAEAVLAESEANADLDAAWLLPVRCGKDLAGAVLVGDRRGGEPIAREELAAIASLARRAGDALRRLRDAETIARERERAVALARLKDEAERAHAARARFLEAAGSELRQPLRELEEAVEAVGERVASQTEPSPSGTVARIRASTQALGEMYRALLDVSELDAGGVRATPQRFDAARLAADLQAEFEAIAERKGLDLRLEIFGDRTRVWSDPLLLARILRNLLANALRYTSAGEVCLRVRGDAGDAVHVEVEDTGPGIPADRRGEIFREFVQLEAATGESESSEKGLGLGLSIVERLARLLGHRVEVESRADGRAGAVFRLTVRAEGAADHSAALAAEPAQAASAAPAGHSA